jgi:hypothetical protein
MPINMGLSTAQDEDFRALLCTHHTIEVTLQVLDLDHAAIGDAISARLIDGQVTVDADAEVTRGLDLDLLDPTGALHLDSGSPDDGAMFADRMIQVKYATINPLWTKRYVTPIFTGPLTKLERSGAIVKVEAQGKEVFGLNPAWNEKSWKKGTKTTAVIRYILTEMMGEAANRVHIPDLKKTLPRNVSVGGDKLPWQVAKSLAASLGYQLFYDGNGHCWMRKNPTGSVFTFATGTGGSIKTDIDAGFSIENLVNAVEVLGKKPKKRKGHTTKKRPHAKVVANRSHPLSPYWPDGLGRPGGPRFFPLVIEDDGIETDKEAKDRANRALRSGLLEGVDVSFDSLVIPHLQELDVVKAKSEKWQGSFRLRQFAIPLTAGGDMTVGYVRNVKPTVSKIRMRAKRTTKRERSR